MSRLIFVVLLFTSAAANAATVTLDFEEFDLNDGFSYGPGAWMPYGDYEFDGGAADSFAGPGIESAVIHYGNNLNGSRAFVASGDLGWAVVWMRRTDGGTFSIESFEAAMIPGDSGYTGITGTLTGGGAADLSAPVGTGDWLNLIELKFEAGGPGFPTSGWAAIELDNIVVSAVPVPAAVWLFGSALAGLGWMRRKQVA